MRRPISPRLLALGRPDQATPRVTVELGQLIAIDFEVVRSRARWRPPLAQERHQHRKHRDGGQ